MLIDANGVVRTQAGSYVSLRRKFRDMALRINPQDILTSREHSRDFDASRAEYIAIRIRTLSLIFALIAPFWLPIDYLVMERETFMRFVALRLGFSSLFLLVGLWGTHCTSLPLARFRLLAFVTVPGLFYFISHQLLNGASVESGILHGYSFLPFLMMALLAIVPLTLIEGAGYTLLNIIFFVLTNLQQGALWTLSTLGEFWLLVLLAAITLWIQMSQLHMLMRLYREATRDALTGLVNRRVLSRKLQEELEKVPAANKQLSILLFDLDLFKRINDNYGHHTGDLVLQAFAEILRKHCHGNNMAGRYGGEEFLAILPGNSVEMARVLAEAIRAACHRCKLHTDDDPQEIRFTTSIGVAGWKPGERASDLLSRVDQGLYAAKAAGRDFVAVAE